MHVISRKRLKEFYSKHHQAEGPLESWYKAMRSKNYQDFNELKLTFASADYVGNDLIVFDIGGNKYRLIAKVIFEYRKVYVRHVFTHAEYDNVKL